MRLPISRIKTATCLFLLSFCFYPTLKWISVSWTDNPYYSHGWLVFLTAVIWGLAASWKLSSKPDFRLMRGSKGTALLVLGLGVWAAGFWLGLNAFKAWAYLLILLFLVIGLEGEKVFQKSYGPVLLLAMAVPIPFLPEAVGVLQKFAVVAASGFLSLLGISVSIQGAVVSVGDASFEIGGACSGFYSAAVLPPLVWLASSLSGNLFRTSLFLTFLSVPCALASNALRVICLLWIGRTFGEAAAMKFWHSAASLIFYAVAAGMVWVLSRALPGPRGPGKGSEASVSGGPLGGGRGAKSLSFFAVVIALVLFLPAISDAAGWHRHPTDTSQYVFTSHQGYFLSRTNFLYSKNIESLPMKIGPWKGGDEGTNDPKILFLRGYEKSGSDAYVHLLVVSGREESKFHISEVCYTDDNWILEKRGYKRLELHGESFGVRYFLARHGEYRHLVVYWFLWKNTSRVITDGAVMVRLSAEVYDDDVEQAEKDIIDFIRHLSELEFGKKPSRTPSGFAGGWFKKLSALYSDAPSASGEGPVPDKSADAGLPPASRLPEKLARAREKALDWLKSQMVPNKIVRGPAYGRRNLIASYRMAPHAPGYIYLFSKSAVYDDALAIIAFSLTDRFADAAKILDAFDHLVSQDGDLYFVYNTHNEWPSPGDDHGAVIRTGASAWVGYAACFFLSVQAAQDPGWVKSNPEDAERYLALAERIADGILKRRITDSDDFRRGLVTGGKGTYVYEVNKGKISEKFVPGEVSWCSVEHNIDAYYFFRELHRLTGKKRYKKVFEAVREGLLAQAWNAKTGQFNRGVRTTGDDPVQALDCASWGACFLASVGRNEKALRALSTVNRYYNEHRGVGGYKPYRKLMIYETAAANAYFYPDDPRKTWDDIRMVWPEGSLGVAIAFIKNGKPEKALDILTDIAGLQDADGGIPYATLNLEFQFSENPSVASAAWFVFASVLLENPSLNRLFWGKELQ